MDKILECSHLHKSYGDIVVLDDVSLSLYEGETLGITGESGSGKSTLAQVIVFLSECEGGAIRLYDTEILDTDTRLSYVRKNLYDRVQLIFQDSVSSFDPRHTIGYSIAERYKNDRLPHKEIKSRVESLLSQCGLPEDFYYKYPSQLSGGQCQRASIARALSCKPEILICDEITSSLDEVNAELIISLLNKLKKDNSLSVIFISHDISLLQSFCDRILIMHRGRLTDPF